MSTLVMTTNCPVVMATPLCSHQLHTPTEVRPRTLVAVGVGPRHGNGLRDPITVGNHDDIVRVMLVSQCLESVLKP